MEIVKVQRSIVPKDGPALIYNKFRSRVVRAPLPRSVVQAMGNDFKLFFEAKWTGATWEIGKRAPWQEW